MEFQNQELENGGILFQRILAEFLIETELSFVKQSILMSHLGITMVII